MGPSLCAPFLRQTAGGFRGQPALAGCGLSVIAASSVSLAEFHRSLSRLSGIDRVFFCPSFLFGG